MIHPIVLFGDPVLEKEAEKVTVFNTPELAKLLEEMFESMYAARGVGLAAPQIGIGKRIAVIDLSVGSDPDQRLLKECFRQARSVQLLLQQFIPH